MKRRKTKEIFIEVEIIRITKKRPAPKKPPEPKPSPAFETGSESFEKKRQTLGTFFRYFF